MNKLKGTTRFFFIMCLILGITLFFINSTAITITDNNSTRNSSQLSNLEKNEEMKNTPNNNSSNIEKLSVASLETKKTKKNSVDKPIPLLNEQDTDNQKPLSRGIINRNTHHRETEKFVETTVSIAQPEVSPSITLKATQNTQSEVNSQYENDLDLLARLITAEAQGEPYDAQVAVGAVVINRLESGLWANTLKDVIYQNIDGYYQFTPVVNGWIDKPAQPKSIEAAKAAMQGIDPTNGAQFYYDDKCTNEWILSKPISIQIGHMIYAY